MNNSDFLLLCKFVWIYLCDVSNNIFLTYVRMRIPMYFQISGGGLKAPASFG